MLTAAQAVTKYIPQNPIDLKMITVNLPTPTQGSSNKNMFAQCLSPLSMPDGAATATSAAVATAVAPNSHSHPQHEFTATSPPPPSKKSNKAVTFHIDTVYNRNPSCSSSNNNTPTTPLHQAAESITKFFSLDNMEQMLNCVPLNVDVLSPTSRGVKGQSKKGTHDCSNSKKGSASESAESGVQHTIGSIFFGTNVPLNTPESKKQKSNNNKFTPQEVTEFSFMAEREAVMNGDTSFDDDEDVDNVENVNPSEQSLLQMVQHTAWNSIHGTLSPRSGLCSGTSAVVAVLDKDDTLVCGAPALALSPNNKGGDCLLPTDAVVVNTANTSKVCSIVDTITAKNKEEHNFGVAGGLWSLPSHDVSHEDEGDDDGSMRIGGTSFVSAATSGCSVDDDALYQNEETVQQQQQDEQHEEIENEAAKAVDQNDVDRVMMMRSPTSATTASSPKTIGSADANTEQLALDLNLVLEHTDYNNPDHLRVVANNNGSNNGVNYHDEEKTGGNKEATTYPDDEANPILAAQRAISHAMLSPTNNPPTKSDADNENGEGYNDKYWSNEGSSYGYDNSGSEEYSDTHPYGQQEEEEEEEETCNTNSLREETHQVDGAENEEDVEAMIQEMLEGCVVEDEGAAMEEEQPETFGGAITVPENYHPSTVPPTQAPIADYHPHHQYATDEEANAHFDQMMSAFELSLNRPQLSTMDERHAFGITTPVSPTRPDTALSSGVINATFGTAFNFDDVVYDEIADMTPSGNTTSGNTTSRYQRRPLPHQPFSPLMAAAATRLGDKKKRQQQQQQPSPSSTSVVSFLEDSVMGKKLNRSTPPSSPVSTIKKALLPSSDQEVRDSVDDNASIVSHSSLLDRVSQSVSQAKQNTEARDSAFAVGKSVADMVKSIQNVIQDGASSVVDDSGEVEEEEEEHMSQADKNASIEDVAPTSSCPEDEPQTDDDDEAKLRTHQTTPKSKRLQRLKPISRRRFAKVQVMERKVSDESSCPDDEKMMKRTGQHQDTTHEVFDDAPEDEKMNFSHQHQLERPKEIVESSIADTTGTGNSFDSSVNWDTLAYSMSVETTALSTRGDREDSSVVKDRTSPFLPPVTPSTARADILEEEESFDDDYYEPTTPSAARAGMLRDSVDSFKEARIPLTQRVEYFNTDDDLPSTPISTVRNSKKARILAQARAYPTSEQQQSANSSPEAWERIERIKQQHDERIGKIRSLANSPKEAIRSESRHITTPLPQHRDVSGLQSNEVPTVPHILATQQYEDESLPISPTAMMSQMKTRIESIKKRHEVKDFQEEEEHQPSKSGYGSKLSVTTSDEENIMPLSPNTMRTQSLKLRLQSMKKQHDLDVLRAQRELQSPRSQREETAGVQSRIDATREQHQRNMDDMREALTKDEKQDVVDARRYECSPRVSKDSKHIAEAVGLWKMNADRFEKAKERFASHRAASPSAKPPSTSHFNFDGTKDQRMDKISDLMMKNADLEEEMRQIRLLSPKKSSHNESWSPSSKSASNNVNDNQHALYTPSSTRLATPKNYSYTSPRQLAVTTSMSSSSEETQMKSRITGLIDEVKQFLSENEQVQERLSDDILALRT